jgi:hypothetical protein
MSKLLGRYPRQLLFVAAIASFLLASGAGRKWC